MDPASVPVLLLMSLVFRDGFTSGNGTIIVGVWPQTVSVAENSPSETRVAEFNFILNDSRSPNISVISNPQSDFFKTYLGRQSEGSYYGGVVLSEQAMLDYETIPMYLLTLHFTAINAPPETAILFVMVSDVIDYLHCNVRIQGGVTIHIPETTSPGSIIYTIVPLYATREVKFTYSISDSSQFEVDTAGNVRLQTAFSHHSTDRNLKLDVSVSNDLGETCSGNLNIVVTPVANQIPTFQNMPTAVSIPEKQGRGYVVTRVEVNGTKPYYLLKNPSPFFRIDKSSGLITTTNDLDLDRNPSLADYPLVIVAHDESYLYSSSATVSVRVLDVNDKAPQCTPSIFVTTIPETTPIGTALFPLTCFDPDFNTTTLSYTIASNAASRFKFKYQDHSVKVNASLDYDVAEMASVNFRYTAAVIITDSGNPPRSTTVSILVTVSPVNEHRPVFQGTKTFAVEENGRGNVFVGLVSATDADWRFNNIKFSIASGNTPLVFYIHPYTGEINTLIPLDFESRKSYPLTIQAVDMDNDLMPDPQNQKTALAAYTINVQNVNDIPPVCEPSIYERTIYSTLASSVPIAAILCTDEDSVSLLYSLVGGNTTNRFFSRRNEVFSRNTFSYRSEGVSDQTAFELLVRVVDDEGSKQGVRLTTTATLLVHVVPWTTTVPTTTAQPTTHTREVKVVTLLNTYWKPPIWFVAVLTAAVVLAGITLAWLLWKAIARSPCYTQLVPPQEMTQSLVQDRLLSDTGSLGNETKNASAKANGDRASQSTISLQQFEGRAVDPGSGREYLFNSDTGARRWV